MGRGQGAAGTAAGAEEQAGAAAEGLDNPWTDVFVSGRLCLFGEHSDWAGEHRKSDPGIAPGRCIVVGTQEGLFARARRLPAPVLRMTATTDAGELLGPREFPLEPEALLQEARSGGFWSYVCGVAYRLVVAHDLGGQGAEVVNHATTLPLSKGLSSSAAVCVLVARAFNRLFGLRLTTRGEMELAYQGEITTPSKCGRMDQACAYGSVPVVLTMDGDILHTEPARLAAPLHLVLVDLAASKCTTTILAALQAHYPAPKGAAGRALHDLLGPVNRDITGRALEAMAAGDAPALGRLMLRAQEEFDQRAGPVCPEQLTAPVLQSLLAHPMLQGLIWGAKGVGSQGDGAAQLLCRSQEAQEAACEFINGRLGMHAMPLTVLPNVEGAGAAAAGAAAAAAEAAVAVVAPAAAAAAAAVAAEVAAEVAAGAAAQGAKASAAARQCVQLVAAAEASRGP